MEVNMNTLVKSSLSAQDLTEDNYLSYATREHGDVGAEEYSEIDFDDAIRVRDKLMKQFPTGIEVHIDTSDEWVNLTINLKK